MSGDPLEALTYTYEAEVGVNPATIWPDEPPVATIIRGSIPRDYVLERMTKAAEAEGLRTAPLATADFVTVGLCVFLGDMRTSFAVSLIEVEAFLVTRKRLPLDGGDLLDPARLDAHCRRLAALAHRILTETIARRESSP